MLLLLKQRTIARSAGQRECDSTLGARNNQDVPARNSKLHLSGSAAPKHPDINPVDYKVWKVMQQRVYQTPFKNVDELKKATG